MTSILFLQAVLALGQSGSVVLAGGSTTSSKLPVSAPRALEPVTPFCEDSPGAALGAGFSLAPPLQVGPPPRALEPVTPFCEDMPGAALGAGFSFAPSLPSGQAPAEEDSTKSPEPKKVLAPLLPHPTHQAIEPAPPVGRPASTPISTAEAQEQAPEEGEPLEVTAPLLPPPLEQEVAKGLLPTGTTAAPPQRWWLMRELQGTWMGSLLDDNRLFVTGWVEQSFTASTDRVSNLPMAWNDRANEYLLQQAWVRIGRSVVTTGTSDPTFGFQVDVLVGSDYRFTLPRGLFNSQLVNSTGAQNLYGVDPIQEYVCAYLPNLFHGVELRLGRLYTPWGVESLEAVSTPLLSRSYAFNSAPPFTNCGLGAYVTFNQEWSGVFMLVNGNDVFFGDPSEEMRFVGNIRWVQPGGGRNTVTLATSLGRGKFNAGAPTPPNQNTVALATEPYGRNNFNAFDLVYTHTFNPVLSYNLEGIYAYQNNVPQAALAVGSDNGFANWFSLAHYLFWTISPQWSSVVRFETFDDAQGQRTGFAGLYTEITTGVQYHINKSMVLRPEVRYDDNILQRPFDGRHELLTVASDLIIRW